MMNTRDHGSDAGPNDRAVQRRLGQLRTLPVDATRLKQSLRAQIGPPPRKGMPVIRSLAAVAAALALMAIIGLSLISGRPAQASTLRQMARMHQAMVTGKISTIKADSIIAADKAIAAQWGGSPDLPRPSQSHIMACCMNPIGNKNVACVLLEYHGTPITMAVAKISDIPMPDCPMMMRHGVEFRVQTIDKLHMVMTRRHNRWICLMGELPQDQLIALADHLRF